MWPITQQPMAWTLTHRIIMILYFLTFLSDISFNFFGYKVLVTIFGNMHRPCRHYFIIINNSLYIVYYFFPHFLAIFTSLTILGNVHRPCKQCINIIKRVYIISSLFLLIFPVLIITMHQHCWQWSPSVSSFFPDFFWFSEYIYMNYHIRKCAQTMYPLYLNMISKYTSCLFFFPDFLLIFS